jgi:hypothetical protein
MAALVLGLAEMGMSPWLAALLVGVVVTGLGAFFASQALDALRHEDFVPRQTIQSLQEDRDWLKEQAS